MTSTYISIQLDEANKTELERAAVIKGQSLTDYVVSVVHTNAKKIIPQHERMTLDDDVFDHFLATCDLPNEPNLALRDAAKCAAKQGF